jgi:hypothetical protein
MQTEKGKKCSQKAIATFQFLQCNKKKRKAIGDQFPSSTFNLIIIRRRGLAMIAKKRFSGQKSAFQ